MTEVYESILVSNLGLPLERLRAKEFVRDRESAIWSSFVHYSLVVDLEEALNIRFSRDDILQFVDYESGLKICKKLSAVASDNDGKE